MAKAKGAFTVTKEDEDETTDRNLSIDGIEFERRDPFGFWHCVNPTHRALEGMFTSQDKVEEAVKRFTALSKEI